MPGLYDRAEIYDLIESESRYQMFKEHWKRILEGRDIKTLLDVSIGSGSASLQLAELGVRLSGSDLSEDMLERCRKKAEDRGLEVELKCCDFRQVSERFAGTFDCVASTGNSLPYVENEDVLLTLEQMDKLIRPGGWLYFEVRNWDKILRSRSRFHPYSPFYDGDTRINLTQIWDFHDDGSITFNLLYVFEKNGGLCQMEVFEEHYHPISREPILEKLRNMGYDGISVMPYPSLIEAEDPDWYCVAARKPG